MLQSGFFWFGKRLFIGVQICTHTIPLMRFEYTLELKYSRSEGYNETTGYPFKG